MKEYEVLLDLSTHQSTFIGCSDFYGRPLSADRSRAVDLAEAVHPDDLDHMLEILGELSRLEDGDVMRYELRFVHADGSVIRASYESTPIERNRDGNVRVVRSKVRWESLTK